MTKYFLLFSGVSQLWLLRMKMSGAFLFGEIEFLVKMGFALGDRKERVCQAQLVPSQMPWHPLLFTNYLAGILSSSEGHCSAGGSKSPRELASPHTHPHTPSRAVFGQWWFGASRITYPVSSVFRLENSRAWPTPVLFNWNIIQMTGGILHFLVATLFTVKWNRWN